MNKKIRKSLLAFVMAMSVLFSVCAFPASAARDFDAEIKALEDKVAQMEQAISNEKASIAELNTQIANLQKQIDLYNGKLRELNKQVAEKDAIIREHDAQIQKLTNEINEANAEKERQTLAIDDTYDKIGKRLKAVYMAGDTSALEILLNADSFESFLSRLQLLASVSKKDNAMIDLLGDQIDELSKTIQTIDEKKTEQEEKKSAVVTERTEIAKVRSSVQTTTNSLNAKQDSIERKVSQVNKKISGLNQNSKEYQDAIKQVERDKEAYLDQITSGSEIGSGDISGGSGNSYGFKVSAKGMICPLQYNNVYVSSPYGMRSSGMHKGIDLCTRGASGNTAGKNIRAAADGVVQTAEYHYSWGNNVYINHGNGIYTRYAHASKLLVKPGQKVKQGDVIALVGNTGNSYGAHLHFEVWRNGTRIDPTSYFIIP